MPGSPEKRWSLKMMRTPAGKECRFFYGDYYRGRNREECRLLASASPPLAWKPEHCASCPVPDILLANACSNLDLTPRLEKPFFIGKSQVRVSTSCLKTGRRGFDAHIGCGECHPLPPEFTGKGL
jgi:hypothetical protein